MENLNEEFNIDCTCFDLYSNLSKKYHFNDCVIIKKCIQNGILNKSDSVCIMGKEQSGKSLLITSILADLTAVNSLKGMNCKVIYLDCDLSFNYKNYENIINEKFDIYIGKENNLNEKKKEYLKESFNNVYYVPIFNPGDFLIILNFIKSLLQKGNNIDAFIIDSISFWNYSLYKKINFFSDKNIVNKTCLELLDYAFTLILNLKKKYKFLLFYTKLNNENDFFEYNLNLSIHLKKNALFNNTKENENLINDSKHITHKFLIPKNLEHTFKSHIFRKKDLITNKLIIEKPHIIFLIRNEKDEFTHIANKNNTKQFDLLLCISSDMKNIDKNDFSNYTFMINDYCVIKSL